jgi:hypothetical protein
MLPTSTAEVVLPGGADFIQGVILQQGRSRLNREKRVASRFRAAVVRAQRTPLDRHLSAGCNFW